MSAPLAIVCGSGGLPLEAAREVRNSGREAFLVGLVGSAPREIEAYPHLWVRLGEVGKLIAALRARNVQEMAFLGAVARPDLADLLPDWGAIVRAGEIAKLFRGGDDMLLRGVAQLFEGEGFRILGPREYAPGLLAPKGEIVGSPPDDEARADIAFGARLLEAMSPFDIGQGVVVSAGRALAVEAAEGTDRMLERVAELRAGGRVRLKGRAGVFVKAAKRGQDVRLDLPAVGPATIAAARRAQLLGLAIAAGEVSGAQVSVLDPVFEHLVGGGEHGGGDREGGFLGSATCAQAVELTLQIRVLNAHGCPGCGNHGGLEPRSTLAYAGRAPFADAFVVARTEAVQERRWASEGKPVVCLPILDLTRFDTHPRV